MLTRPIGSSRTVPAAAGIKIVCPRFKASSQASRSIRTAPPSGTRMWQRLSPPSDLAVLNCHRSTTNLSQATSRCTCPRARRLSRAGRRGPISKSITSSDCSYVQRTRLAVAPDSIPVDTGGKWCRSTAGFPRSPDLSPIAWTVPAGMNRQSPTAGSNEWRHLVGPSLLPAIVAVTRGRYPVSDRRRSGYPGSACITIQASVLPRSGGVSRAAC